MHYCKSELCMLCISKVIWKSHLHAARQRNDCRGRIPSPDHSQTVQHAARLG